MTLNALFEGLAEYKAFFVETRELTEESFSKTSKDDIWIIGNTFGLNQESFKVLNAILLTRKFVKIEFDYGFCPYRCEQGFKNFTGLDKWEPFGEKGNTVLRNIYDLKRKLAYKIFYMSNAQMEIHSKMMDFAPVQEDRMAVLGSCFSVKHLMFMIEKYLQKQRQFGDTYAIVDGNGGWHSKAKGVKEAILYAKENSLKFKLIKENDYDKFLHLLSQYKGLIFLPQIHDTCPRVTIEAKLMGLDLITNDNSQHATEEWFSLEGENLANYLLERPQFFKKEISGLLT